MLNNKIIAVVVPAYNEEEQIKTVIETMPEFVDRIIIVNDCSVDGTEEIVKNYIKNDLKQTIKINNKYINLKETRFNRAEILLREMSEKEIKFFTPSNFFNKNDHDRLILINHEKNTGVGAAIATGYKWCKDHDIDCTAVMAGDGQMDPDELELLCKPVVFEDIDYVKGNRLIHRSSWLVIPKLRYFGNSILSILTKIASGYWHVSDTQTGYTAISKKALNAFKLYDIYKGYGMPNDILVKLNIAFCTLKEVEIKPVYDVGEKSKMNVLKVIPKISLLLFFSFFKRLFIKYFFRDFHPIFFLYNLSFIFIIINIPMIIKILITLFSGLTVTFQALLAFLFLSISSFQSFLSAMWMDIQDNEKLYR